MIITVGGIKGGAGKTTIATNLTAMRALANKKVLLVDADDQRSASDWVEHRQALGINTPWTTIQLTGIAVHKEVPKMLEHYDDIIIDTGGRDTASQRAAISIADILIAPFQPRSFDVWTLGNLNKLLNELITYNSKLKVYAVINRADSKGSDNSDAMEILSERIQCIPVTIGQRKAFSNAASEGLGVMELKSSDKKATQEIEELYNAIFAQN